MSITRIERLDWQRDQYRVGVTNTESYPVKIVVSLTEPGDLGTHELQPGKTWFKPIDPPPCTKTPLVLGIDVRILEKNGVEIPPSFEKYSLKETFEDCLIESDLVVTVGHEKADRPSEAKILLEVTNKGKNELVVTAKIGRAHV